MIICKLDKNSNDGRGKIFQDIFNIAPIIEISYIHILCIDERRDFFYKKRDSLQNIQAKIFKLFLRLST